MKITELTESASITNKIKFIRENCSQILKVYSTLTSKRLYHGFEWKQSLPLMFKGKPYAHRIPKDTDISVQKKLDEMLKSAGFTALRSNSIFCTGDNTVAQCFGDEYIIFPYDNFKFTWSPNINDLTLDFNLHKLSIENYKRSTSPESNKTREFMKYLLADSAKNLIKRYDFTNKNILAAINSKNEIYISSPYIAICKHSGEEELDYFLRTLGRKEAK